MCFACYVYNNVIFSHIRTFALYNCPNIDECWMSLTFVVGCRCWMTGWASVDTLWWVTKRVDAEQTQASTRRRLTARREFQQVPRCSYRPWTRTMTRRAYHVLIWLLEPYPTARIVPGLHHHRDMSATQSIGRTPTSLKQHVALNRVPTSGLFSLFCYRLKPQFTLQRNATVFGRIRRMMWIRLERSPSDRWVLTSWTGRTKQTATETVDNIVDWYKAGLYKS